MSEQQVDEILESVPEEIDRLCSRILTNLMAVSRNFEPIMIILRLIVCASRSLMVGELRESLRFDIGETPPQLEKTVGSICGNLVFVDTRTRIRYVHQTVREYLLRNNSSSPFIIQSLPAHSWIAAVCMKYHDDFTLSTGYCRITTTKRIYICRLRQQTFFRPCPHVFIFR